jgi:PQQ-dependent catabolism-associated CXXCW motif protein
MDRSQANIDRRRRSFVRGLSMALLATTITPPASAADDLFDAATGYRIKHYQAPAPTSVPGGTRVSLEELQALAKDKAAILLDVMSADGAVIDPTTGNWQLKKPRTHMPGSVWLPNVGRGVLTPALDAYYRDNLERFTGGRRDQPIVIYCQADCWMGWNAVKRAASYGYTGLYWYPDGTDGMADWDVPLVPATPVPMPPARP